MRFRASWRAHVTLTAAALAGICDPNHAARADTVDISPDGQQIAYIWSGALVVSGIGGNSVTQIDGGDHSVFVRWSPNGRQIAFVTQTSSGSELKLFNTVTRKVRSIGGNLRAPLAWREDGNRFACTHDLAAGGRELVWYNLAENGVSFRVPLSFELPASAPMVWLPTTDDVALAAADHNVYSVEAGEVKKITTSNDVIGLNLYAGGKKLVWTRRGPNMRYILMSAYAYDLTERSVIRLLLPDRVTALNPDPRTAPESVNRAIFSPDGGRLLLFVTLVTPGRPKYDALYTIASDGRIARRIQTTSAVGEPLDAAWARSISDIAVLYSRPGGQKLFLIGADGGGGHVIRTDQHP